VWTTQVEDLLLVGLIAFLGTLVCIPIFRATAVHFGLTDAPDGRRKLQRRPIPVSGGLAILTTLALVVGFSPLIVSSDSIILDLVSVRWLMPLAIATAVLGIVGLIDDAIGLRGRHKLLGQLVAIVIVLSPGDVGIEAVTVLGNRVELGVFGIAFTTFWLLGAINALNLIDGMDGLLGSIALTTCITFGLIAVITSNLVVAVVAIALAGALIAFLCFNLPPAKIYLGDCGSMTIGLILGTLAVHGSLKGPAAVTLAIPLIALILPIFDTLAAIIRRKLTGRSIYTTDRGHLHHRLLSSGLSRPQILGMVFLFGIITATGSIASIITRVEIYAWISGGIVVISLLATRLFGVAEVNLIRERFRSYFTRLRSRRHDEQYLEVQLQGTVDWNDLWEELTLQANAMKLHSVWLDVNAPALHENYHARWDRRYVLMDELEQWRAELPLFLDDRPIGRLIAVGQRDQQPLWEKLARLTELIDLTENRVAHLTADRLERIPKKHATATVAIA
jgi:UDP-GlcNAc:undecaprenyl-phosphate/decaprenyl-phosphate GlcNAc-1-phosphate transferase